MPKELKCHMCNKDLGQMEKGTIRNGSALLCRECIHLFVMATYVIKDIDSSSMDFFGFGKDSTQNKVKKQPEEPEEKLPKGKEIISMRVFYNDKEKECSK